MTDVRFAIDYFDGTINRRWPEAELAAHVDELVTLDDYVDGVLVIGATEISDYMPSAVLRLCFSCIEDLLVPRGAYHYHYESENAAATLQTSDDGDTVTVLGWDAKRQDLPARELLSALYACGMRFLAWVDTLAARGRDCTDMEQLREAAPKARALLERRGWR